MRNNMNPKTGTMRRNVVYRFTCPHSDCKRCSQPVDYIGATTTTLSRRMTMHLQAGHAPYQHMMSRHQHTITRSDLEGNTKIIDSNPDHQKLWILEALWVNQELPVINKQQKLTAETKLFGSAF